MDSSQARVRTTELAPATSRAWCRENAAPLDNRVMNRVRSWDATAASAGPAVGRFPTVINVAHRRDGIVPAAALAPATTTPRLWRRQGWGIGIRRRTA